MSARANPASRIAWRRTRRARLPTGDVLWSAAEAAGAATLSAVSAFVVARLAGPAELGVGAAIVAVHVLLWVLVNALFADALVQRDAVDADTVASARAGSVAAGIIAALAQVGAGFLLADAFDDGRIGPMALALAWPLPLVGAAGVAQGMLLRRRAYRSLAWRTLLGQGLGVVVGVGLALDGAGAWALVGQQALTSALGAAILLAQSREARAPGKIRLDAIAALLRIGGKLALSTLVLHGRYRVFVVALGWTVGAAALGQVHMAFRLIDTGRELANSALWRLLLPRFAEKQADGPALLRAVDRAMARIGWVLFPASGAALLVVPTVIAVLLGPAWAPAGAAALPLVGLACVNFLLFAPGVALIARGRPGVALASNAMTVAVLLPLLAVLRPATPAEAAWVWAASQAAGWPILLRGAARALDVPLWRPLRDGLLALTAAAGATLFAWALPGSGWWQPALQVAALGAAFAVAWAAARGAVWRAAALLLVCLAAPADAQDVRDYFPDGVPGVGAAPGVTVLSRARPETDPTGVRRDGWLFRPSLLLAGGLDDNPLASPRTQARATSVVSPSLSASGEFRHVTLGAAVSLTDTRIIGLPRQGRDDATLSAGASGAIGRGVLVGSLSQLFLHQEQTALDAVRSDAPVGFTVTDARLRYDYAPGTVTISPDASVTRYRYGTATINGQTASQTARDRDFVVGGAVFRKQLGGADAVVSLHANGTSYAQPGVATPSRDSTGAVVLAGLADDAGDIWRWRALGGVSTRQFAASAYGSHTAPVADAAVIYQPGGMVTVTLDATRSVEDSAQEGVAAYDQTRARITVDYEYRRNVLLQTRALVARADYVQGGTQRAYGAGAAATWLVSRTARLVASYDWSQQDGSARGVVATPYTRDLALLTLTLAR